MVEKSMNKSMRTSKKMEIFAGEPMGEKLVTELPGIGPVLGERLRAVGFDLVTFVIFFKFTICYNR